MPRKSIRISEAQAKKVQGKLTFRRIPKEQTTAPPLATVLSQYELLLMVTKHLSSADLVHLAATSKEISTYVKGSDRIYNSIKWDAVCDGKGIEARAKCFGHFRGKPEDATVECEGRKCAPCDNCEAMVCNSCRYHLTYLDNMSCCKGDPEHWEYHEIDFAEVIDAVRRCHEGHCGACPGFHSGNFPIEGIRAALLAGEPRERRFCTDCKPHFLHKGKLQLTEIFEMLDMLDDDDEFCHCNLTTQFIDDRWLCIPCFFEMEAQAHTHRTKRDVYRWKTSGDNEEKGELFRELVKTEYFCDCGKVADVPLLVKCRWCDEYIRTPDVEGIIW